MSKHKHIQTRAVQISCMETKGQAQPVPRIHRAVSMFQGVNLDPEPLMLCLLQHPPLLTCEKRKTSSSSGVRSSWEHIDQQTVALSKESPEVRHDLCYKVMPSPISSLRIVHS